MSAPACTVRFYRLGTVLRVRRFSLEIRVLAGILEKLATVMVPGRTQTGWKHLLSFFPFNFPRQRQEPNGRTCEIPSPK